MKGTEQKVRGQFPTVARSSPYCTVRNTRENESSVCHYIKHLRHKHPKAVVTFSLLSTVVRLMRQSCCWPPGLTHRPAHSQGPRWHWVSRWDSLPLQPELGWLEDLGWPGFSPHVASHLRLLTTRWSGRESVMESPESVMESPSS